IRASAWVLRNRTLPLSSQSTRPSGSESSERRRRVDSALDSPTAVVAASVTSSREISAALQSIANGISSWALMGTLIALLLGAGLWAVGSHTQNAHQSMAGRRAVVTALVAAVLIGAAPALLNFFFN